MSDEPASRFAIDAAALQGVTLRPAPNNILINGENGTPLVTIHPSGELEYGPGYTPDEAARRFWDAMRHYMPAHCPRCDRVRTFCSPEQNTASLGHLRRSKDVLELIDREECP